MRSISSYDMLLEWLVRTGNSGNVMEEFDIKLNALSYRLQLLSDSRRRRIQDNEDALAVHLNGNEAPLIGIFDGATTVKASDFFEKAAMTPGKAASLIARETLRNLPFRITPKEALFEINDRIREASRLISDQDGLCVELSTTGLVAKVVGNYVEWASIGDSNLVKIEGAKSFFLTSDFVEAFELKEYEAAARDSERRGIPISKVLYYYDTECWRVINENRAKENSLTGGGTGILKGSPNEQIKSYIEAGVFELKSGDKTLLFTDGLSLPVSVPRVDRLRFLSTALQGGSIVGLLKAVREHEEQDPLCKEYPRLKVHDDATGVLITRL